MEKVTDPVCGMSIDPATAAGKSTFEGKDYYFCAPGCKTDFDADPKRYTGAESGSTIGNWPDQNPPITKKDGMTSPKFGSATSGGAEFEPLPPNTRD